MKKEFFLKNIQKNLNYEQKFSNLSRTLKYKEKEISKLKRKTESNKNESHSFLTFNGTNHLQAPPDFHDNNEIMKELTELLEVMPHLRRYSRKLYE